MAKLNDTSKGILGEASEKIGNYTESTGGGTPLAKGEKLKDHPEAKRVMQPRDEDGQFTYNSVNGKGLKYGPSRGTTVPPFLRGVKLTFCAPGTKLKIDGQDGIKIKIMTIDMSVEEIVNACKEYIESEEGFAGMGEGSSITKKGRKSKEEKAAKAGQIGNVDPKTLSQGTQKEMSDAAIKYAQSNSANEVNPMVGGYQVINDTLTASGNTVRNTPARYWEKNKNQKPNTVPTSSNPNSPTGTNAPTGTGPSNPSSGGNGNANQTPVTPSGAQVNNLNQKNNDSKVLKQMGLNDDDKEFDVESIKNDPKAFANSIQFKSIWNKIPKDSGIKPGQIVKAIANGKFKNPTQLKKWISKKYPS